MEEKDLKMTLATDLLHELKQSSRRWFIAFLIVEGDYNGGFSDRN